MQTKPESVIALARRSGITESALDELWEKALTLTSQDFGIERHLFKTREMEYAVSVVREHLPIKESSMSSVTDFLNSPKSAKEYLETVTSGSFQVPSRPDAVGIRKKKVVENPVMDVEDNGHPEAPQAIPAPEEVVIPAAHPEPDIEVPRDETSPVSENDLSYLDDLLLV